MTARRSPTPIAADDPRHGDASTYSNHGCRCQPCRDAKAAYMKAWRYANGERLAADPGFAEHGHASTYVNYRCRCMACTNAHRAGDR